MIEKTLRYPDQGAKQEQAPATEPGGINASTFWRLYLGTLALSALCGIWWAYS